MAVFGIPSAVGYGASDALLKSVAAVIDDDEATVSARRELAADINKVLHGNFADLVNERLAVRFHPKTYAEMAVSQYLSTRINLMNDAVNKLWPAIWPSAKYTLVRDGASVESPEFENFIKRSNLDVVMRKVAKLVLVHPAVLVMPWVAKSERSNARKLTFRVLTPEHFSVKVCSEDPSEWEELRLYHDDGDEQCMTVWTNTYVAEYTRRRAGDRWVLKEQEEGEMNPMPNPYSIIPGVVFRADPLCVWSANHGPMLLEATTEVNVAQTLATYNAPGQVKSLAGAFADMQAGQRLRHAGMIDTGAAPNVQVLDFTADVEGFRRAFIEAERRMVAVTLGLPADEFESTTVPPSGESLKLRYLARTQMAERLRADMVPMLQELYVVTQTVLAVEVERKTELDDGAEVTLPPVIGFPDRASLPPYDDGKGFDQTYTLGVDVDDLMFPETQAERQARIDYDISKGFTTAARELSRENSDIADAAAEIAKNLAETARMSRASSGPTMAQRFMAKPVQAGQPQPGVSGAEPAQAQQNGGAK